MTCVCQSLSPRTRAKLHSQQTHGAFLSSRRRTFTRPGSLSVFSPHPRKRKKGMIPGNCLIMRLSDSQIGRCQSKSNLHHLFYKPRVTWCAVSVCAAGFLHSLAFNDFVENIVLVHRPGSKREICSQEKCHQNASYAMHRALTKIITKTLRWISSYSTEQDVMLACSPELGKFRKKIAKSSCLARP